MSNEQFQLVGTHHPWQGMNVEILLRKIMIRFKLPLIRILCFDSFIENFGTHVITSVTVGGKDVIYVKQHQSSPLSTMEIKKYVQEIGNQRFSDTEIHTHSGQMKFKDKASSTKYLMPLLFFFSSFISIDFLVTVDLLW